MSTHQDFPFVKTADRDRDGIGGGTADMHEISPDDRGRPGTRPGGVRVRASEAGMATAEYAIATLAAVGFAGVLVFIMRSDEVRGFLLNLIRSALALP